MASNITTAASQVALPKLLRMLLQHVASKSNLELILGGNLYGLPGTPSCISSRLGGFIGVPLMDDSCKALLHGAGNI